ncbi:MAG: hypothetical protein QNK23_16435 [Crocinitomicaceae bacterium]|nr:hypothetical protein [Crocinitomicaceae bacterium]
MSLAPNQIKHLEMIQGIVTRMNTNSFQIKGFTLAIVTGVLAVYANTKNIWLIQIGYIPVIILWILDSYYLQHERKFRGLYNSIVNESVSTDFKEFQMPLGNYRNGEYSLLSAMFVSVNCFIYLAILTFFVVFGLIIK